MFLQCVSTVIIVYIIISPLNSYLYIHWIFDLNEYYYYYHSMKILNNKKCSIFITGKVDIVVLLSTHSHDPCQWGESDVPACGPPASFPVHLASSVVTPAGSVHKSRGDNVERMWVQLKR